MSCPALLDPTDARVLTFPTGQRAEFRYPVAATVDVDGEAGDPSAVGLVVMLNVPPGATLNENVFGVRCDGLIAWQIPDDGTIGLGAPYTGMKRDGDAVLCYNFSGADVWVDPATGVVLRKRLGR